MDERVRDAIERGVAIVNARWAWVEARFEECGARGAFVIGRTNEGGAFAIEVWDDEAGAVWVDGEQVDEAMVSIEQDVDMAVNGYAFA